MLWLALYLPDFPLEALLRGGAGLEPAVVAAKCGNRPQVLVCNAAAEALGIRPGMGVPAAQAVAGQLEVHARDTEKERAALSGLAVWAGQFSPAVSLQPSQGLLLEVGGCLRLFGGLGKLIQQAREGLEALGYRVSIACAPTPLGAWLLARAGVALQLRNLTELAQHLANLPLALLDQPPAALAALEGMGVRTIGDCLRLPRDGLACRFGQSLLDELDRALGRVPDARKYFVPPARFESALELPAEAWEAEALLFAARRLLLELEGFMKGRQGGVQQFSLTLLHEYQSATRIAVGLLAPSRHAPHLFMLLRERLEQTELPAPARSLILSAEEIFPLERKSLSLFPGANEEAESWNQFVEHLRARLGVDAVHGLCQAPDHRPEFAWRICEPGGNEGASASAPRPLWLLPEPRPLSVIKGKPCLGGPLALKQGPERIESGWWDGRPVARDYYIAENSSGASFWVFRERQEWFVHGIAG